MTGVPPAADSPAWVGRLLGLPGLAVAFAWGVAEATFFFIVPDLVIALAALFSARRSLGHLAAVTAGSVLAGAAMYAWADRDPAAARAAVARVPGVPPAMFAAAAEALRDHGAWGLCRGPLSGIPYKVYAVEAPPRVALGPFVLASVPARLERLILAWAVFAAAGRWLRPRGPRAALAFFGLYWAVVYVLYWGVL